VKLAELVKQRTNGDVEITVLPIQPAGQRRCHDQWHAWRHDRSSCPVVRPTSTASWPNTAAMELPFVFRSAQHAYAVLDGDDRDRRT
jgi:TRAP-type C4-dicarboxylate transport system substrate-binding protein